MSDSVYPLEKGKSIQYKFSRLSYKPFINEVALVSEFARRVNSRPESFKAVFARDDTGVRIVVTDGDDDLMLEGVTFKEVDGILEVEGYFETSHVVFSLLEIQLVDVS
jgi:hypothetical protein